MGFRNAVQRISELAADLITGAVIQTATTGQRIVMNTTPLMQFFTGVIGEVAPGLIRADGAGGWPILSIWSPIPFEFGPGPAQASHIELRGSDGSGANISTIQLLADKVVSSLLQAAQGIQIGPSTVQISAINFGDSGAQTTDASGTVTISHNLQTTPTAVFCLVTNPGHPWAVWGPTPAQKGNSNFTVTFRRTDTDAVAGAGIGVRFYWLAIA